MSAGEPIIFPYALLNQKRTRKNDFDMTIGILPQDILTMPVDYGSHKSNSIYDVIEVIVHELLHGMGIISYVNSFTEEGSYRGPGYNIESKNGIYSIYFAKGIFDKYLYSGGNYMHDIVQSMSKNLPYIKAKVYIENIPRLSQLKQIGDFITGESYVYFITASNKAVYIKENETVTSLGHLSNMAYHISLDHIMTPSSIPYAYVILNHSLVQDWVTAPLGNNTIDILETLGYQKNRFPRRERSQLALYEEMRKYNYKPGDIEYKYAPIFKKQ
ncbi:hypothetical protein DSO57_1022189 [Entomophthora muscae]|uniref:Uncharacterized protein n=1 Tax=Entomophthora muscae TaxID=34485 RepID=A0ACC2SG52_9FUNG|nr:hypothetical protein DSO57_1022189 [Entomophthora muscae]